MNPYTDIQLDTLREVATSGSGTASTALSQLLDRPVDISIPEARALPLAEALEAGGAPETPVTGVVIPVVGDIPAVVLSSQPGDVVAWNYRIVHAAFNGPPRRRHLSFGFRQMEPDDDTTPNGHRS